MSIYGDRLNEAMMFKHVSQADLSRALRIPSSQVNQYCTGRNKPKYEVMKPISIFLGVNIDWLMGEDVPMLPDEQEMSYLSNLVYTDDRCLRVCLQF